MKLEKSPQSALLLTSAAVLSFVIAQAVFNLLVPYLISGDIRTVIANPESMAAPSSLAGVILLVLILLALMIAMGTFWLYRFFGEKYFGSGSLVRWALFGALFALLVQIPKWLFPEGSWGIKMVFEALSLFAAFFLVRWMIPFRQDENRKTSS